MEARTLGLDLDGNCSPDSQLSKGDLALTRIGAMLGREVPTALSSGAILWQLHVETCTDGQPYARVFLEDTQARPAQFPAVGERQADGRIVAAHGVGSVPIHAFLEATPSTEPTVFTRGEGMALELTPAGGGIAGRLGAALPRGEMEALFTTLAKSFNDIVAADPGCPSACETMLARRLLELFDDDRSGSFVPIPELRDNDLMRALVKPDLDLHDESVGGAVYLPRHDGFKDHLSYGLIFHAVPL
jgi:hypothetical protein